MRETAFFRGALVAALAVHGATLFALSRIGQGRLAPAVPGEESPFEIGIEVASSEVIDTRSPAEQSRPELARGRVPAPLGALAANAAHQDRTSTSGESASLAPGPPRPADSAGHPWTFSPTTSGTVWLGLRDSPNARSSFQGGGSPAGQADAPPPSTTGAAESMRAALDEHDLDIGMNAGGPLVDPTRDAVRTSLVPDFAHALLEFTTDETGLVVSVRVLDSNSDVHVWDEVARKITLDARKKPLRVPRGAQGLAVTMLVESKLVSASGHDQHEGTLKRVLSGSFEPTDLLLDSQDKPQRVVQARVVSERRL
jgi:hypothetical protein